MSGVIAVTAQDRIPLSTAMFEWIIVTLADEVHDPELRTILTEISENRLSWLGIRPRPEDDQEDSDLIDLTAAQADELTETALRTLIPRAEKDFAREPRLRANIVEVVNDFNARLIRAAEHHD